MNQNNRIVLPLVAALALVACEQRETVVPVEQANETELALDTTEERLSYSIAYGLGLRLKGDGVPVDVAAFSAGLTDSFGDRPARLTGEEIGREMQAFQRKRAGELQAQASARSEANTEEGAKFLAANAAADDVVVLESGLQYKIIGEGAGAKPGLTDRVEVHYEGKLIDGTVFDSSIARGAPAIFAVNQVIPGWTQALQLMPVGSRWQLFIPSELAYGAAGTGAQIGPNATLIFDVELIGIK